MSGIQYGHSPDRNPQARPASDPQREPDVRKGGPVSQDYFLPPPYKKTGNRQQGGQPPARRDRQPVAGASLKRPQPEGEISDVSAGSSKKIKREYSAETVEKAREAYLQECLNILSKPASKNYAVGKVLLESEGKIPDDVERGTVLSKGRNLIKEQEWGNS